MRGYELQKSLKKDGTSQTVLELWMESTSSFNALSEVDQIITITSSFSALFYTYTFVVSRAFMAGAASQAGDADSSRAPGLTSGLQGSVNVHRGVLLLVPQ